MKKDPRWILLTTALLMCITIIGIGRASPGTAVGVDPPEVKDLEPGESFTVNITVTDVVINMETPPYSNGLYGWSVEMTFNPAIINVENVTEGPFLKQIDKRYFLPGPINNTRGHGMIGGMYNPAETPAQGAAGSGVLATVTFTVKGKGETDIELEPVKLRTVLEGNSVPIEDVDITNGRFVNAAPSILSIELIVGVVAVVAIAGIAVFFYIRRK